MGVGVRRVSLRASAHLEIALQIGDLSFIAGKRRVQWLERRWVEPGLVGDLGSPVLGIAVCDFEIVDAHTHVVHFL